MAVSDAEIDSEVTYQCQYLASLFKGGHYPSFCNMYVVKRVANAFWDEYKKLDHDALADAYEEFDENYRNTYTQKHQYGNYDVSETVTIDKEIEHRDIIQEVHKMVYDNIDRKIIMMILEGLTYDEIAQKLGISKMDITRRMRAVGQRYKEQENLNDSKKC